MVGVPGRSKGCKTCRRRKKGCDLQRPACRQCQVAKLQCEGYSHDIVFVNVTSATASRRHSQNGPSEIALPQKLAQSAYREKYLGLFWGAYLPNGCSFPPKSAQYTNGVWTNELHRVFHQADPGLKSVLLALSLTSLGRRDGIPWMVENGTKLYGESLASIATRLRNESRARQVSDSTLATTRLLCLYEILYGNDDKDKLRQPRNWNMHVNGELSLIMSRPPGSFVKGYSHQLFVDGRRHLICADIRTRKRCRLNEPEWKSIPWLEIPKTPKDLLCDIFAEIPGILEDLDTLRSTRHLPQNVIPRQELIQECWWLEDRWLRWRREHAPNQAIFISDGASESSFLDRFSAAHVMATYWSIGVFLYTTIRIASGARASANLPSRTDPRVCCKMISDLLPTFAHPSAGVYGEHSANFSTIVALAYLNEIDGSLDGDLAQMFLSSGSPGGPGKAIQHFVTNIRRQDMEGGRRKFAPMYD